MTNKKIHRHHFDYVPVFFIMSSCEKVALEFCEWLLLILEDIDRHKDEDERIQCCMILCHDQGGYCTKNDKHLYD